MRSEAAVGMVRWCRLLIGAGVTLAIFAACSGASSAGGGAAAIPSVDALVENGLVDIGENREEIFARLGDPESVRSNVVPNRHIPGVEDTLYTVTYDGLSVEVHRPGGGGDMISTVEVWDNRFLRYPAVGVGALVSDVRDALGSPDEVRDDVLVYRCRGCMGADRSVDLVTSGGRVERVRFNYYVD